MLSEIERERADTARAQARKGQVGSGDRSQRIRTYNFPQGRVTDHRINLTLHKLDEVLEGGALDEFIDALITEHQASQLALASSSSALNAANRSTVRRCSVHERSSVSRMSAMRVCAGLSG